MTQTATLPKQLQTDDPRSASERLLEIYKIIIDANVAGNKEIAKHGLALLKNSLQPKENLVLARHLSFLYEAAESALDGDRRDITGEILETLRGSWAASIRCSELDK